MNNLNIKDVKRYMERPSFLNPLSITNSGNLFFHWSNHRVTKKKVLKNFNNLSFIAKSIWIKTEESYIEMSTSDLLNYVTTNNKKTDIIESIYELKEISFDGPMGPFEELSLVECFNELDLRSKYLEMTLKNKVPQRSFRLSCSDDVLMCYDEKFLKDLKVTLHQINKTGILLKSSHGFIREILEEGLEFKLYIASDKLDFVDRFYSESEKDSFVVAKEDVKVCNSVLTESDETYFFVKFSQIKNKSFVTNMQSYLALAEKEILKAAA